MPADRVRPVVREAALARAAGAIVVFGTAPASIKAVSLDVYSLGVLRLAVAALGMTALLVSRRELSLRTISAWPRQTWTLLIAVGTLFGLHWLTYFLSIRWATASIGAVGFTTYGVQLPLMGWLFGFGRPSLRTWIALAIALAGAACFVPQWSFEADMAPGLLVGLLSGTTYAALPLLHQRHAHISNGVRTWAQFCFALPVFLLLAPLAEWQFVAADALWLINLALIIPMFGHFLWVQATTELPVQVTAVCAYLQLPTSMFLAWLLIGEEMTGAMWIGAALVITGNVLAINDVRRNRRRQTDASDFAE